MPLSLNLFPKEKSAAEHPISPHYELYSLISHANKGEAYTEYRDRAESIKAWDRKVER